MYDVTCLSNWAFIMTGYQIDKTAHAIIYFLEAGVAHLGKTKLMKLMFFADKYHLEHYAKSLFHDTYLKLPFGPVPVVTLNTIDSINEVEREDFEPLVQQFLHWVDVQEVGESKVKKMRFEAKCPFDACLFSRSELEALSYTAETFKDHTAVALSELSHQLPAYFQTANNNIITEAMIAPEHADFLIHLMTDHLALQETLR